MRIVLLLLSFVLFQLAVATVGNATGKAENTYKLKPSTPFFLGADYWTENAVLKLSGQWNEVAVDKEFGRLSSMGISVVRVLPVWSDFQPLKTDGNDFERKLRNGLVEGLNHVGIDTLQMQQFVRLSDLAAKHRLRLIVGLAFTWRNGRFYGPDAMLNKNPVVDMAMQMYQLRYVSYFVKAMRYHPAILAWDISFDRKMMGGCIREQAYSWMSTISNVVRSCDKTRPIILGGRNLSALTRSGVWRMQDIGENSDLITAFFNSGDEIPGNKDDFSTLRTVMERIAEVRVYSDISGVGSIAVDENGVVKNDSSKNMNATLFNLWAGNCSGILLDYACVNQETVMNFGRFLKRFPHSLPVRKVDAVCIVAENSEQKPIVNTVCVLSKQAGFEVGFQNIAQPLKEAPIYMVPCVGNITRSLTVELLDKVKKGATLYVSTNGGALSPFLQEAGIVVEQSSARPDTAEIKLKGKVNRMYRIKASRRYDIRLAGAEAIACEGDNNPAFTVGHYGKGKIYFLTVPLELYLGRNRLASFKKGSPEYWRIYEAFAESVNAGKLIRKTDPVLSYSEHFVTSDEAIVVMVNNGTKDVTTPVKIKHGWRCDTIYYGGDLKLGKMTIKANDAVVFSLKAII